MKTKTQRYADRLYDYTNWLLGVWEKGEDVDSKKINKCLKKIDYLIALLKIDAQKIGNMQWFNIPFQKQEEKKYQSLWEEYQKRPLNEQLSKVPTREEILRDIQLKAQQITEIPEIEAGAYRKESITAEKLQELLFSLKQIKKDVDSGMAIDRSEGESANQLLIEVGFISRWRPLAIEIGLVKDSVMPYPRPEIAQSGINWFTGNFCYSDSLKKSISKWIDKVQKMLSKPEKQCDNDSIPPEYKSAPVMLRTMIPTDYVWSGIKRKKSIRLRWNIVNIFLERCTMKQNGCSKPEYSRL